MSILKKLKETVKIDVDISLIEVLFHVNFDCKGERNCHVNHDGIANTFLEEWYNFALTFRRDNYTVCNYERY